MFAAPSKRVSSSRTTPISPTGTGRGRGRPRKQQDPSLSLMSPSSSRQTSRRPIHASPAATTSSSSSGTGPFSFRRRVLDPNYVIEYCEPEPHSYEFSRRIRAVVENKDGKYGNGQDTEWDPSRFIQSMINSRNKKRNVVAPHPMDNYYDNHDDQMYSNQQQHYNQESKQRMFRSK